MCLVHSCSCPDVAVTADSEAAPQGTPAAPSPLEIARLARRQGMLQRAGEVRLLECLPCEQRTEHVPGPATLDKDGNVLVQWWKCVECTDGHTVG